MGITKINRNVNFILLQEIPTSMMYFFVVATTMNNYFFFLQLLDFLITMNLCVKNQAKNINRFEMNLVVVLNWIWMVEDGRLFYGNFFQSLCNITKQPTHIFNKVTFFVSWCERAWAWTISVSRRRRRRYEERWIIKLVFLFLVLCCCLDHLSSSSSSCSDLESKINPPFFYVCWCVEHIAIIGGNLYESEWTEVYGMESL